MIDHIGVRTPHFDAMVAFYTGALTPLGYKIMMQYEGVVGIGRETPDFWISAAENASDIHLAFGTDDRAVVDAFHAAAPASGGKDNGAPGKRDYTSTYYAAFVTDPDGNNLEVVCHAEA